MNKREPINHIQDFWLMQYLHGQGICGIRFITFHYTVLTKSSSGNPLASSLFSGLNTEVMFEYAAPLPAARLASLFPPGKIQGTTATRKVPTLYDRLSRKSLHNRMISFRRKYPLWRPQSFVFRMKYYTSCEVLKHPAAFVIICTIFPLIANNGGLLLAKAFTKNEL